MEEMNLRKMMKGLAAVDDMTWGMYAFSRDALRDKVDGYFKSPGDCRKAGTQGGIPG